jgi:hypothetical protein
MRQRRTTAQRAHQHTVAFALSQSAAEFSEKPMNPVADANRQQHRAEAVGGRGCENLVMRRSIVLQRRQNNLDTQLMSGMIEIAQPAGNMARAAGVKIALQPQQRGKC